MLLRQVRWFGANGRRALDALRSTSALDWQFSRASGPGGQHVNKVNTRAELRLDLDHATQSRALPRDVADRLTKHSTKERVVVVSAQTARTQKGNREACEAKLAELLEEAWHPPKARKQREGISKDGKRARTADKRRRRDVKSNRGRVDYFSTSARSLTTLADKRLQSAKELAALPEVVAAETLRQQLASGTLPTQTSSAPPLDADQTRLVVDAGLATFHLHVEARIAAYCGEGFYTIGPCGEELLGAVGLVLEDGDGAALHYRHLATNVVRSLRRGDALEDLLLARARGYVVSGADPACGGVHCCVVGGGADDWLVTSTLASQAPRAVGRALADAFKPRRQRERRVEYVSVGDGSVNNAHFLSAVNFAEYCAHRGAAMPVVFGVADNDASISLAGHGWLPKFIEQRLGGCKIFSCDGAVGSDVFRAAAEAFAYARHEQRPAVLVFENLPRRFGHAATDRQDAYLSPTEIEGRRARDPLAGFIGDAVERGVLDAETVAARNDEISRAVRAAFDAAAAEPKLDDRAALVKRVAAPLAPVPPTPAATTGKKDVLRKHATRVLDELLSKHEDVVYIGEDVEHGGYYLVSEGLKAKHGRRVRDVPPDETALLGAAAGLAQRGLVPIVEVPYAKYLDCGFLRGNQPRRVDAIRNLIFAQVASTNLRR